jgi:hypothetical protein
MGGPIFNEGGTLTVTNSTLQNNTAQGGNGGVDLLFTPLASPFGNGCSAMAAQSPIIGEQFI